MENALLGFSKKQLPAEIEAIIKTVNCHYLAYALGEYVCNETMYKKRKPTNLGGNGPLVLKRCRACQSRNVEIQNEKLENERRKSNMRKVLSFMKFFTALSVDGFDASLILCSCDMLDHNLYASRDGVTLPCSKLEGEIVDINDVCRQTINPDLSTPCEYLVEMVHHVKLADNEKVKEIRERAALPPPPSPCTAYPLECPDDIVNCAFRANIERLGKFCPEDPPVIDGELYKIPGVGGDDPT